MATRRSAIAAYAPSLELGNIIQEAELSLYLANRTGLNEGSIELVLRRLREAIIFFSRAGRPVKIEGLGTYTPSINLDGTLNMKYHPDEELEKGLNVRGRFSGNIHNRANIGKTVNGLVAMWNKDHPDDPVK